MDICDLAEEFNKVSTLELETCDLMSENSFIVSQAKAGCEDHETTAEVKQIENCLFKLDFWNDLEGTILTLKLMINLQDVTPTIEAIYQVMDAYNTLERAHEHIATIVDSMDEFDSSF